MHLKWLFVYIISDYSHEMWTQAKKRVIFTEQHSEALWHRGRRSVRLVILSLKSQVWLDQDCLMSLPVEPDLCLFTQQERTGSCQQPKHQNTGCHDMQGGGGGGVPPSRCKQLKTFSYLIVLTLCAHWVILTWLGLKFIWILCWQQMVEREKSWIFVAWRGGSHVQGCWEMQS